MINKLRFEKCDYYTWKCVNLFMSHAQASSSAFAFLQKYPNADTKVVDELIINQQTGEDMIIHYFTLRFANAADEVDFIMRESI